MTKKNSWLAARRILAVRMDNLGDVLMSTPALRALRGETGSARHISLLAGPSGAAAAPFIPEVDALIVAEGPWMPDAPTTPEALLRLVDTLRAQAFDAAVIFTVYSQNPLPAALLCWLAGIPLRLAHCRENPYHLLTDWQQDPEPHEQLRHEVQRQLDLVAAVGFNTRDTRLSFRVPPAAVGTSLAKLRAAGVDPGQPWLVLHPGASAAARCYPPEYFARALERISADFPRHQWVLTGTDAERGIVAAVQMGLARPIADLAGRLTLAELAVAIARADLLVANNTGPVHLAAALGTPVTDVYALTNPQHAPWQVPHRVLYHDVPCRFCYRSVCPQAHHDCLRLLAPERLAQAARELLQQGAQRSFAPRSDAITQHRRIAGD